MKQIILSNEEEANEELMWQPTGATTMAAARAATSSGSCCCSVTGVTLSATTVTLDVNESETLVATVAPDDATDSSVRWSSDNESVATVSSGGLVCAKKAGTATITVETNDGGFKKSCTVTVEQPVTGVSISKTSLSLEANGSYTLAATVSPSNASNPKVVWTSDNEDVATVSSGGLVCAKKAGTATITAETEDGGYKASCEVTVKEENIKIEEILLSVNSPLLLDVDEHRLLAAIISPSDASNQDVLWESSNPQVATISPSGVLIACGEGDTTITATATDGSNVMATCEVTVVLRITALSLNTVSLDMVIGKTAQLEVNSYPKNVADKSVIWYSDNMEIAEVDDNGLITAKKEGSTFITVATPDKRVLRRCSVRVRRSEYGTIIYDGEEYNIYVPITDLKDGEFLVSSETYETIKTISRNEIQFDMATFLAGEIEDEGIKSDAIYGGDNSKYPLLKPETTHLGVAAANTVLNLTTVLLESLDNYYVYFLFQKSSTGKKRVRILAGSSKNVSLASKYADDVERSGLVLQSSLADRYSFSRSVANYYHLLTKNEIDYSKEYDLKVTLDKAHKDNLYTSSLWINKDHEIIETPLFCANDRVRITCRDNSGEVTLCTINLKTSHKVNAVYQKLFGEIVDYIANGST